MWQVRHIRSLIGASHADYTTAQGSTLPGEYSVIGYNPDRRVVLILAVRADRASHAVKAADDWVQRANKVRPNYWRTSPGI